MRLHTGQVYNLADQQLSSDGGHTGRTGNNIITFDLSGASTRLILDGHIFDHDALGSVAEDCSFHFVTDAYSLSEWQSMNRTIIMDRTLRDETTNDNLGPAYPNIFGQTDDLTCVFSMKLVGQPLP